MKKNNKRHGVRQRLTFSYFCKKTGLMISSNTKVKNIGVKNALFGLLSPNCWNQSHSIMLLKSIPDRSATKEIKTFLFWNGRNLNPYIKKKLEEGLLPEQEKELVIGVLYK